MPNRSSNSSSRAANSSSVSGVAEDVVGDVVAEEADLAFEPEPPDGAVHLEPECVLGVEVLVADLECQVTGVRTVVIQLLERGIAGRARDVERDDEVIVGGLRLEPQPHRSGEFVEVAGAQTAFGFVTRVIQTAAELHRCMGDWLSLHRESPRTPADRPAATTLPHRWRRRRDSGTSHRMSCPTSRPARLCDSKTSPSSVSLWNVVPISSPSSSECS